jgi:hypothetical protein
MNSYIKTLKSLLLVFLLFALCGCSKESAVAPYDAKEYVQESELVGDGRSLSELASEYNPVHNFDTALSVPTYITKVDDTWFIVDCYHNRIIYSDQLGLPLDQWYIMSDNATQPHTLASDGIVYLIDDTENNRILVFEKADNKFINTQVLYNIGVRPHYSVYDSKTDTFYVWSSKTGELYCLRHTPDSTRMYITDIRKIPQLDGMYVRSFSIIDGDIYFVSGVSDEGADATILKCDLETLEIKKSIPVPNDLAGMVQITKIQNYYYITVSTDLTGSQDYATIIRTKSLEDLSSGKYEDIYSKYFIGGGTPYYISRVDDSYFLTEHRLQGHSIWSFKVKNNEITDVTSLY